MWAYGAHYRADNKDFALHVTYNLGIANIQSETVPNSIDVGVLKDIMMVSFGTLTTVVMKVSWIKHNVHGRQTIKQDVAGFWTICFGVREEANRVSPYIYPATYMQVCFVDDAIDPTWKVMVLHDPRSRRIVGVRRQMMFGSASGNLDVEVLPPLGLYLSEGNHQFGGQDADLVVVPYASVQTVDAEMTLDSEDNDFNDEEDEEEIAPVL
jgi:hypothetical protein